MNWILLEICAWIVAAVGVAVVGISVLRVLTPREPRARGDFASQTAGFALLRNTGIYSANDCLRAMHQNPIPADEGGDLRIVQPGVVPLDALRRAGGSEFLAAEAATMTVGRLDLFTWIAGGLAIFVSLLPVWVTWRHR